MDKKTKRLFSISCMAIVVLSIFMIAAPAMADDRCPTKPDLTIIKKSEALDGDALSVTYTIKNIGDGSAGESTTCIYADGDLLTTDPVGALAAGESHTSTVTIDQFDCPCGTTVTINVCADNYDDVDESNEENNCLENKFKCPPCPCKEPDLTIIKKSEALDGDALSVKYTIKNIGDGDAGASTTCIYADGVEIATDPVGALKAGKSYTRTVTIDPFDCTCGKTIVINVCADNYDDVDESDENNNCLENKFKCPPCPCKEPDLTIIEKSEAWVSLDDTTYTITYTVKNNGDWDAAASTTTITINGVEVATDSVPELASGESYSSTLGPFTIQGHCDTIVVCADGGDKVDESNEGNNCRRNMLCPSGDVPALTPFGAAILIGSLSLFAVASMRRRDE